MRKDFLDAPARQSAAVPRSEPVGSQTTPPAADDLASGAAPADAAVSSDRSDKDEESDEEQELEGSELGRQLYWVRFARRCAALPARRTSED